MRILLVDDNEAVRRGIRSILSTRPEFAICGEAADGVGAIEKAEQLQPDAVLMDVTMPRMNGLDATRRIRKALPEVKVVIISQNDPRIMARQASAVDAHAFIEKVQLGDNLIATLARLIPQSKVVETAAPAPQAALRNGARGNWLFSGGTLGHLIRERDWSNTPLGPLEAWPHSLRNSVNLMLNSQHPMWIGWGREMIFLYNDAYISVLSLAKHPWALGRPAQEVWLEIWDTCGPLAEKVFTNGEPSYVDNVRLFMSRGEYLEETYYSFSYSPIYDESGKVTGLFCPSAETTASVLHTRRLQTLSELSAKTLVEKLIHASCASSMRTLAKNPDDIPFALLYLVDETGELAVLHGRSHVPQSLEHLSPFQIRLSAGAPDLSIWPAAEVIASSRPRTVSLKQVEPHLLGSAEQPVSEALMLPLSSGSEERPFGVLVAGVNPTRRVDAEYRTFFTLVADQLATAIQNARAAEEEKRRAEALTELDRAKTAFFSNVSHEFRTPLTLMLGPLQDLLARSQNHLSPTAKEQLELVNRNGSRLLRLVNTLLDFSRIEAGRVEALYEATDLSSLTAELASTFRSATERAGLKLIVDCGPVGEPVYVDREMWEKIVLNLVSNAFKFTFEGEIEVGIHRVARAIELRVRDTGVGIPAEEIPRLFERFHRVPNTRSRTYEGSGIGLALVNELVKQHGGLMRVESAVGQGSTFIVSVPLGQDHLTLHRLGGSRKLRSTAVGAAPFVEEALRWLPDAPADEEVLSSSDETLPLTPLATSGSVSSPRACIIIADDNSDMRRYLSRLLRDRYDLVAVADGQAALEAARGRHPDLILSDVMMPRLDGLGLIQQLRADPSLSAIPVILLSARAGQESLLEGVESGADDYLVKPFGARELLARVEAHLKMKRLREQAQIKQQQLAAEFETVVNNAPVGVYVLGSDFRFRQVNPIARAVIGDVPDLIGRDFEEVIRSLWPGKDADEVVRIFRHTLETGESYAVAERIEQRVDRGGATEYYEWRVDRIPIPDGGNGLVCYFRDVSERVRGREDYRALANSLESDVRSRTADLETKNAEVQKQSDLLREFSHRLLQAQDEERRHIARELHDSSGQMLTALAINLGRIAQRAQSAASEVAQDAEESLQLVQQLSQDIRTMSYLLHPPLLDESGVSGALQWYVEGFTKRSGIDVGLEIDGNFGRFSSEIELTIFRIIQEALTNIHRHSGSKRAIIRLALNENEVAIEIQDFGKGIPPEKLREIHSGGAGVGYRGMRERVHQVQGHLSVASDSSGTSISVVFPIVSPRTEHSQMTQRFTQPASHSLDN